MMDEYGSQITEIYEDLNNVYFNIATCYQQ